jgi:hypothetical protein
MDESIMGLTSLLLNLLEMNREHRDRPIQTEKRIVKLEWLMRNIPSGGAKAMEILKDRKK